jgi:tRNA pseudouridine38-40 synthase
VRVRLDLGYDGTDFAGWARQPGQRTVQGVLEAALARALRLPQTPRITCAGRTDAGVHARGQVAHADVPAVAWADAEAHVVRSLRGLLPADVRVLACRPAPAGFDARFSGLWRRYAYRVSDLPGGVDPLRRHEVLHHKRPLDVDAMDRAAQPLVGLHDFAAFCRARPDGTTIRDLQRLSWERTSEGLVVGTVVADAFCHSMVRAMVGCLLAVGDGRQPADWPARLLATERRDPTVTVAAAKGLTLEEVGYPPDAELAARAEQTRGIRTR